MVIIILSYRGQVLRFKWRSRDMKLHLLVDIVWFPRRPNHNIRHIDHSKRQITLIFGHVSTLLASRSFPY